MHSKRLAVCVLLMLAACGGAPTAGSMPTVAPASQPTTVPAAKPAAQTSEGATVTTPSGLQYTALTAGSGEAPKPGDIVAVHYVGRLQDGTEFDNSRKRGEPIRFALGRGMVIKGWDEGIALMKPGGTARLVIPPDLGYGARGAGGVIPPNATLTFEVELVSVSAGAPAAPTNVEAAQFTTTPTGLKYYDLALGSGAEAKAGQTVSVHYTGWLTDGTQFDSSLNRGEPFEFRLGAGQVIAGWDQGVAGMKVGGKRQLVIPATLGYGARGAGDVIPPNAVLVFEVELLAIQ